MNLINDQRRPEERIQETRLVRREKAAHESNADPDSSQAFGCHVSPSEHKQVGSDRNYDQGENATASVTIGGDGFGKISERLKLIERTFLAYVHGHQERLEERLDESRAVEENFLLSVRELERDLDSLISEQSDGSEQSNPETSFQLGTTKTHDNE